VVYSKESVLEDVLSNQFIVQSPKKSCEYLVGAINKFLVEMRAKFKQLTDEEFETQRKSVHTIIAEKDINLSRDNSRMWGEIMKHRYCFDKQARDIDTLATVTKQDVQALFEKVFFSSDSKRLDLELTSSAHAEEQAKLREENEGHEAFKVFKARVKVTDSVENFKK